MTASDAQDVSFFIRVNGTTTNFQSSTSGDSTRGNIVHASTICHFHRGDWFDFYFAVSELTGSQEEYGDFTAQLIEPTRFSKKRNADGFGKTFPKG